MFAAAGADAAMAVDAGDDRADRRQVDVVVGVDFGHVAGREGVLALLVRQGPGDPIYKGIALSTLTHIEGAGLVVSDPLGSWLQNEWPSIFVSPSAIRMTAWVGAVMAGSALNGTIVCTPAAGMLKAIVSAPAFPLASRIACRNEPAPTSCP